MPQFFTPHDFATLFYQTVTEKLASTPKSVSRTHTPEDSPPPLDAIRTLVIECYRASFDTEEGRPVQVRLRFNHRFNYFDHYAHFFVKCVRLASPIPLSSDNIIRLSPVAQPDMQDMIVTICNDIPVISGFAMSQKSYDAFSNSSLGGDIALEILGPGRLRLTYENYHLVELNAGDVRLYSSFTSASQFCSQFLKAVESRLEEFENASYVSDSTKSMLKMNRENVNRVSIAWIASLIRRIRDLKHGGTLLFGSEVATSGISVKYPVEKIDVVGLILRGEIQKWERDAMHVSFSDDTKVPRSRLPDVKIDIDGAISSIVGMSSVDGAVLFSPSFAMLGFGTRVAVDQGESVPSVTHMRRENGFYTSKEYDTKRLGMRHQSAVQFVSLGVDRQAFVISTDCNVRFFYNDNGNVKMRDDFEVSVRPQATSTAYSSVINRESPSAPKTFTASRPPY
jgi:hypothetical protein